VTAAFSVWHVLGLIRRRRGVPLDQQRLTLEVLVDVATVTALLCLAGGWVNPFVSIYLIPVGFAAALLSARRALAVAAATFAGYLLTIFVYVPLPALAHGPDGGFSLHLLGMWISFVLAAAVLLATVLLVRRAYDQEREALGREREARLRDEQLLALGALAASTAHELGTPLSTARMLVEAMEEEGVEPGDGLAQLAHHLDQVSATLHRLVRVADPQERQDVELADFCAQLADRFRTLRPDVELTAADVPPGGAPIRANHLLESALLSLMINAATASVQASRPRVELQCDAQDGLLRVRIRDYGHGFPDVGQRTRQHNGEGLGVGLVISSATIERYRGTAHHYPRDPGTEVVVSLPLDALRAPP
jgi:two-component system sensor histidine kinase RegB